MNLAKFSNLCSKLLRVPPLHSDYGIKQQRYLPTIQMAVGFDCRTYCATTTNPPKDKLYRQVTVEVKGHDPSVINSYQKFTTMAAEQLGITIANISEPPKVITRKSLLKSVFVFKKHQHQYEQRTLFRVFEFKHLTESTALTFLEYIQRNLPEGMAMKVTKHELHPMPEHLKPPEHSRLGTEPSS